MQKLEKFHELIFDSIHLGFLFVKKPQSKISLRKVVQVDFQLKMRKVSSYDFL